MKHEAPTWIRKGRTVLPANPVDAAADGLKAQTFPSISMAKKYSLGLQMANGGRGCGFVRVARGK